jgi:DNA-binding transcriptional ArsR family regulator
MDDEMQREARALGDPTRHRLFRHILTAPDAVGVADLTNHVQLNHNAVRQHLAVLKEAKLVVEDVKVRRRCCRRVSRCRGLGGHPRGDIRHRNRRSTGSGDRSTRIPAFHEDDGEDVAA